MELYLRYALELSIVFPAAVMSYIPVHKRLRTRPAILYPVIFLMLAAFVVIGSVACVRFDLSSLFVIIPFLLLCLQVYHYSVNLRIDKKLFCFLNAAMLCSFCANYTGFLTAPTETKEGPLSVHGGLVLLSLALLTIGIFSRTFAVKFPYLLEETSIDHAWPYLNMVPFTLLIVFLYITPEDPTIIRAGRIRTVALIAFLLVPVALFLLYHMFWWVTRHMAESAALKQENSVLRMEQKRYETLQTYMTATRELRHDFRQHLLVIKDLAQSGETEKLQEYVSDLTTRAGTAPAALCANRTLDAVFSYYEIKAAEQGIKIEWTLDLPQELPIKDLDLCSLMGNLLENSIDAAAKCPEDNRSIRVISRLISGSMLGISVENTYVGKVRFNRNGLPRATQLGHGIGMESISRTVQNYNGTLDISAKNGVFAVNIMLYPEVKITDSQPADAAEEKG